MTVLLTETILVRTVDLLPYTDALQLMHTFTARRQADTPDEIWLVQHPPVFTQGHAGRAEHIVNPGDIPVIQSDRGGQVTYHAPGQQIMYVLLDLRRRKLSARELVTALEQCVIQTLRQYGLTACARQDAPGVYVDNKKICSLGLRISRGCSFHGLALNVAMDLAPFQRIHPCGYADLTMTQLSDLLAETPDAAQVRQQLVNTFCQLLGTTAYQHADWPPALATAPAGRDTSASLIMESENNE